MPAQSCEKKLCLVFSLTFEGCIKSAFGSKENREEKKVQCSWQLTCAKVHFTEKVFWS